VEGFKGAAIPKLEVYRESVGKPLLHPRDPRIVAVATDGPLETGLPMLPLGDPDVVATFILVHLGLMGVRN
jgi:molybdopterin-guanine dinucleotide biosynthesis protein B